MQLKLILYYLLGLKPVFSNKGSRGLAAIVTVFKAIEIISLSI
jgi:hypothetical protein